MGDETSVLTADEDKILDALRKLYVLNQQILTRVEAIEKSVGTVEATHSYPPKPLGKRPWESGWSKDKVESEPEQTTNTEPEIPDNVKETFNL